MGNLKVDRVTREEASTQGGTLSKLSGKETIGDLDAIVRAIVFSYFTPEECSPTASIIELELHVVETIGDGSTGGIEETALEIHGGGGGGGGGRQEEEGGEKEEESEADDRLASTESAEKSKQCQQQRGSMGDYAARNTRPNGGSAKNPIHFVLLPFLSSLSLADSPNISIVALL
ncbi:hypothetical protein KA093_00460 [Candidatus Saccharibacteria bacterium]|nr:hypothetical protein [Candidatus Saccharibacteria bacterium]